MARMTQDMAGLSQHVTQDVVHRRLGKAEVASSILAGGTSKNNLLAKTFRAACAHNARRRAAAVARAIVEGAVVVGFIFAVAFLIVAFSGPSTNERPGVEAACVDTGDC